MSSHAALVIAERILGEPWEVVNGNGGPGALEFGAIRGQASVGPGGCGLGVHVLCSFCIPWPP